MASLGVQKQIPETAISQFEIDTSNSAFKNKDSEVVIFTFDSKIKSEIAYSEFEVNTFKSEQCFASLKSTWNS